MNYYALKYFKAVAEIGNMTSAAEELKVSQPAISRAIKQLEEDLGVDLFVRQGRSIHLNHYGETFLTYLDYSFSALSEGKRVVREISGLENGEITIGVTLPHVFPNLLSNFLRDYPHVRIKQYEAASGLMLEKLLRDQLDFWIATHEINHDQVETLPIISEEIFVTVSRQHPLAQAKQVALSDLKGEKFVGSSQGYSFRELTDGFCQQAGFTPDYQIELEDAAAIHKLVEAGYGISFTPKISLLSSQEKIIPLRIADYSIQRTISLVYKKDHYFSQAAKAFFDFSKDYLRDFA
ncbi:MULTISPECIES: LysR family transcriptional regulator [Aerococcus]|uniref:LysR family transcriptional regulator n=2 Tax=Aerococcus TaxID=1375 RepID=A0A178HCP7_9LACT|nr:MULTISPECIES: LysR family transcriptional regulator [Aerococcus]MCY3026332.1 LysR family transcriptional regulator [Aerococcus loyolae]MCY3028071.1 LysR family transcriptional regulator [Aerococcus loyolae]MCY3029879.1 LysR family transcriptional regulator [Aerococcus loyolae]MDK6729205.1 LysR family transcriptional regulator [Aerococcus urinae]MDK7910474.1 LysR family transcriptional regulator [Aerococcus urinae]